MKRHQQWLTAGLTGGMLVLLAGCATEGNAADSNVDHLETDKSIAVQLELDDKYIARNV